MLIKMSFADTLTSFLYTLSHPSELAETDGSTTSTSLIFILDSFDEFLLHPRQALLYNLFDIAQSRKAPIAVICLGRQVNAIDGLEKRVKSRFSGRIEHVGRPRNEDEFWRVCEATLTVDDGPGFVREWNCHIKVVLKNDLCSYQDLADHAVMKDLVHEIFVESRDVREFFNRSIPVISALRHNGEFLPSAESWSKQFLLPPDSKLSLIEGSKTFKKSNLRTFPTRAKSPNQCNPSRDLLCTRNIQLQHGLRNLYNSRLPLKNTFILRDSTRRSDCAARWRSTIMGKRYCGKGVGKVRGDRSLDGSLWEGRGKRKVYEM